MFERHLGGAPTREGGNWVTSDRRTSDRSHLHTRVHNPSAIPLPLCLRFIHHSDVDLAIRREMHSRRRLARDHHNTQCLLTRIPTIVRSLVRSLWGTNLHRDRETRHFRSSSSSSLPINSTLLRSRVQGGVCDLRCYASLRAPRKPAFLVWREMKVQ